MKTLVAILLALMMSASYAQTLTPPQQAELTAYIDVLEKEIQAGRMSLEQGKYLAIQRANQFISQNEADRRAREAAALNSLGIAIQGLNQSARPIYPGPTLNCNTFQRGQFGNINCF